MNIDDCYQNLSDAIILRAVKDYRNAKKDLLENPKDKSLRNRIKAIVKFFRSEWFGVLTGIDPEELIKRLEREG